MNTIVRIYNLSIYFFLTLQNSSNGQDCNLKDIEDIISQVTLRVNENLFNTILNCDKEKITKITLNLPSLSKLPDLSYMTYLEKFSINSCYNDIENLGVISNVKSLKKLELHSIGSGLHEKMIDFSQLTNLTYLSLRGNKLWSDDLENLTVLKNNENLEIHLENNSIIDASALLELDTSCKIYLSGNVNLTQESKDALKARFGSNVSF
jgi:hypothetical protein